MDGIYLITLLLNTLQPVSEAEVIKAYLNQKPLLIEQQIVQQKIAATAVKRGYWENPEIGSEFGHNISTGELESTLIKGSIALPLGRPDQKEDRMRRSGIAALKAELNLNRFQRVCRLRRALNRLSFQKQSLDIIGKNLKQMAAYEAKIKTLVDLKQLPDLTLKMFQLKHKLHRQEHQNISEQYRIEQQQLKLLTGIDLTGGITLKPLKKVVTNIDQHHALKLFKATALRERAQLQYTETLNQTVLNLEAGINTLIDDGLKPGYTIGFSINLPLFNRFKPEQAEAKSAYQVTLLQQQQEVININRDITLARRGVAELERSKTLYTVDQHQSLIDEALLLFKEGNYQITDLAELILTLEEQKLKKIEWETRYREALLTLRCARGYFEPEIETLINQKIDQE